MLHGLVSILTLLAMLLHAAFGCCWHHTHAGCQTEGMKCVADQESANDAHEHHVCSNSRDKGHGQHSETEESGRAVGASSVTSHEQDDRHHEHGGCDEDSCKYVASNVFKVPTPADGCWIFEGFSTADVLTSRLVVGLRCDRWWSNSLLVYEAGPSVRDLTQTWLL
ncbi:hypothetical protein [Thalassoroseus pseudoceratinae]|uniref:hypothetical protein n=1 Tax=Thalassoroseus pseudoceratinae TaxID=2713176 RepID=UPI00141DE8A5|nr:hypothetical protein [Thalassoroseus pseudoceratinae]